MGWFANARTRTKLLLGFGVLLVLLGVVVAVGYQGIAALDASQRVIVEEEFRASIRLLKIRSHLNHQRADMLELLHGTDRAAHTASEREMVSRAVEIDKLGREVEVILNRRNQAEELALMAESMRLHAAYNATQTQEMALARQGKVEEARALAAGKQQERIDKVRASLHKLAGNMEADSTKAVAKARERTSDTLRLFALIAALALAFCVFLVWLMNRLIAAPLQAVTRTAERVAAGDLSVQVETVDRKDEVGALQRALGAMVGNLRESNQELRSGFSVLASSSTEIFATVSQVAAGATETATAVSETSTTAEEVKQTAHLSNQKAKAVQEAAQKAVAVSETGRKSVAETIEGMGRIREQMESIAESVVQLSEQGQTIGEIIATVNDLAEQSNLLAVNAAIEATRAGEFGKGFAVVAQEVKNLAEQSRQATTQVRTILMAVQKATSAAVMATEQGTKAVAAGVTQASEAGESIRVLAGTVGEAAQAATQIAASSQQQIVGMDQIASAIANIREATSQNLEGTKQLEASAQGLQELGTRLKVLVERQRVEA